MEDFSTLEVVFKVAEVCNSNCTYCYYFKSTNSDFTDKPKIVKEKTVEQLVAFLKNAVISYQLSLVHIGFHGGECLLLGKRRFNKMAEMIRSELDKLCEVRLNAQTNGMLIDKEWIDIFSKYKISVSVSMDGNEELHNKNRIDRSGRGTYQRVLKGLDLLIDARKNKKILSGGLLCVINPSVSGKEVYRHFVDNIGMKNLYFIPPDYTVDTVPKGVADGVRNFYAEVIEEWKKDNSPHIDKEMLIKICESILMLILHPQAGESRDSMVITIRADGTIEPDDELRSIFKYFTIGEYNVSNCTLSTYLSDEGVRKINEGKNKIADDCQDCILKRICKSGNIISSCLDRFSIKNKFNNKNIYCTTAQKVISEVFKYAISRGVNQKTIEDSLL